jgi:pyruvate kinase
LIDGGMNVARFNFSHGDYISHGACLDRLQEAVAQRPGCNVAVMLDTKGPEIRTGKVDASLGGKVKLTKGDIIEIGTDFNRPCTSSHLACSYKSLPKTVKTGSRILVADGSLLLEVTEIKPESVMARVMNNCSFGDNKNMNLPGAIVDLPTLTPKDVEDLQLFGVARNVDFIAASFVRKPDDIDYIRTVLGPKGAHIKIIAKIENQEGLENFDAILEKTDGIMVARGDLGMEIPIEKVFLAQKMMIRKSNVAGKPVVTATQMLESMITNPRPTRAECADVANAVLDGTDCVMLSGETANGEYPGDAVRMMANTCVEAESIIGYDQADTSIRRSVLAQFGVMAPAESIASSAVKTAWDVKAKLIIVLTETGNSARLISKFRPNVPVYVLTPSASVARQCQGYLKNCVSTIILSSQGIEKILSEAMAESRSRGWCNEGDTVVCVFGSKEVSGSTNMVRVAIA